MHPDPCFTISGRRRPRPSSSPIIAAESMPHPATALGLPIVIALVLGLLAVGVSRVQAADGPSPGPAVAADGGGWPQWAGPQRNFAVPGPGVGTWGDGGPKKLWQRDLGNGYSSIASDGQNLYTLDRDGDRERVLAVRADSGETVWESAYDAPHLEGMRMGYGSGPHSTPLVEGGRVFTVGATAQFVAWNAGDGKELWRHDLWGELGGNLLRRGYAASPLAYGDTVILPVGGEAQGFIAFDQGTGEVRWRSPSFDASQSSPILIEASGGPQLIGFVADQVVAVNPATGEDLWRHPHPAGAVYNIGTPQFTDDGLLVVSSAYGGGTRGLAPSEDRAEERWHTSRMKVHFSNTIQTGGLLLGSSGNVGSLILTAVDLANGDVLWKNRGLGRVNLLRLGDGRVLALGEDGDLSLLRVDREGVEVLSSSRIHDGKTWTVPILVGGSLYLRNEGALMAFELPVAPG